MSHEQMEWPAWRKMWAIGRLIFSLVALGVYIAGCGNENTVRVKMHTEASTSKDPLRLDIRAEVTGPVAGLSYKWYSVSGECEPQKTDEPETSFLFAENAHRDRISLEVWRADKLVAQDEINVELSEEQLRLLGEHIPEVALTITNIPPYDTYGGDKTHADIGGMVSGKFDPDFNVVIYTRVADTWYIQPMAYSVIAITNGTWSSWTHTGSSYGALLVRPGYEAMTRLDLLPPVGSYVVAKTVVEGLKK